MATARRRCSSAALVRFDRYRAVRLYGACEAVGAARGGTSTVKQSPVATKPFASGTSGASATGATQSPKATPQARRRTPTPHLWNSLPGSASPTQPPASAPQWNVPSAASSQAPPASISHTRTPTAPSASTSPTLPQSPSGSQVVASRGRWKFHRPNCEWAMKIYSANKVQYSDSAAARRAGLTPCLSCRP